MFDVRLSHDRCVIIDRYAYLYSKRTRKIKKKKFENEISHAPKMHLSFPLSFFPFLRRSRKQNIGASQSEKGSTMHVAQLAIHRRQLASFFPQRTKVRDNRYVGAASRTLTLGDPIFRSLPSLPFDGPLCLCSRRFLSLLASLSTTLVLGREREAILLLLSPSPPHYASCLTCTFSGISLYLRSGESAAVAKSQKSEPAMRARCAMRPPRGVPPMQPRKGPIGFHHRNPRKSFVYIYSLSKPLSDDSSYFSRNSERASYLSSSLLTDFRSQLPFSRRCNDTFNCSSLNRGCHEQSEHQKWIELMAGPVAGTSSTWLDLQVSSPTSYFASRKSIWNWQNYYFFFSSLLGYEILCR